MYRESKLAGRVVLAENLKTVARSTGRLVALNHGIILVISPDGEVEQHHVPYGANICVLPDQQVKAGTAIADWDERSHPIVAERDAVVMHIDMVEGLSLARQVDEVTGLSTWVVISRKEVREPRLVLTADVDEPFQNCTRVLPASTIVYFGHGAEVNAGDVIARIPVDAKPAPVKPRDEGFSF